MPHVQCTICKKEIYRKPRDLQEYKDPVCGRACMGALRRLKYSGNANPKWSGGKQTRFCEICGKPVTRNAHELNKNTHTFCSRQCKQSWNRRTTTSCAACGKVLRLIPSHVEKSPNHFCNFACRDALKTQMAFAKRVSKQCLVCSKEMRPKRESALFCSRACHGIWDSRNKIGPANPGWKGGYSDYYGPNWKQQQRAARQRDKFTCQHCGKTQKQLNRALDVHHIRPFRTFGYIPGENKNYLSANELTNLISLCVKCHKRAEYGHISVQPYLL